MEADHTGSLSPRAARAKVSRLRLRLGELSREVKAVDRSVSKIVELVIELHERQAHTALGYDEWDEFLVAERLQILGLGEDESNEVLREMLRHNFSSRAVGPVLGLKIDAGRYRARKLLKSPDVDQSKFGMVRSLDSKVRPRFPKSKAEPVSTVLPGQESFELFASPTAGTGGSFDVAGFLADSGESNTVDETVLQIATVEGITQELQMAMVSLSSVVPDVRHAPLIRRLLTHTANIADQRKQVASQWGFPA